MVYNGLYITAVYGMVLGMVSGSFFPLSLGQPDLRSLGRAGPFKGMGLAHGVLGYWGTVPRGKPQFD